MIWTILSGLLLLAAIALFIAGSRKSKTDDEPQPQRDEYDSSYEYNEALIAWQRKRGSSFKDGKAMKALAGLLALAGLVILALAVTTIVPARSYGVVTEFQRPIGRELDAGLHLKAPWQGVQDMDGTIQQINNDGGAVPEDLKDKPEASRSKTEVRLTNQSVMYVENIVRWRIRKEAASDLYQDWKEFERIDPGLVSKEVNAAINVALTDYDPYVAPEEAPSKESLSNEVLDVLAGPAPTRNTGKIGAQIEIVSLSVIKVDFDAKTQDNIQVLQQETANTKTAQQKVLTAEQDRLAALKYAQAYNDNPSALVKECLNLIDKHGGQVQPEYQPGLPATLNCNFLTSNGSGTVVPTR
jgi:regulator of protease activity HflC (stomatin/prohibitin superfamily)